MVSPTDGWAVGGYLGFGSAGFRFLVLHWNGTNWARLPSPAPGNGVLYGVHMVSASNGWAVGEGITSAGPRPVMLHWNGTAWKQVPVSFSGGIGVLAGVSAPSGSNAWAVGWTGGNPGVRTLVVHWNGTRWARVPSPNPGPDSDQLTGVSAISASDAWAVGVYYPRSGAAGQKKTLTLHWNGTAWKQIASPSPGRGDPKSNQANELAGVAALSSSNAWSVGDYTASTGQAALTLHWNGTRWAQAANQGGTSGGRHLGGISMVSASDGWAVGGDEDAGKVIILRWNGSTWARS